jgi:rod shape-determining protein MreC
MESFLNRYRNITVLLLVLFAQLVLLAVQVKNDQDVRMIRVWTVTAVTPLARVVESLRGGSAGFVRNYIMLRDTDAENKRLRQERDSYKLENIFLKNELSRADRAKALQTFQQQMPSRSLAATVIGFPPGANAKMVYVDRGTVNGVMRGMAVVTPDGIVGEVYAAYPVASTVLLATDPDFAAGVISQKNQVRATLKGQGTPVCKADYVQNEEKVETGEWFYTSGDDRIFPRGFPVGIVKTARAGQPYKEILIEPAGMQRGLQDVLILLDTVHQSIPDTPPATQPVYIAPPPPGSALPAVAPGASGATGAPAATGSPTPPSSTLADRLRNEYKAAGDAQKHTFGSGGVGSTPPDFTKLGIAPKPAAQAAPPAAGGNPAGPTPTPAVKPQTAPAQPGAGAAPAVRQPGAQQPTSSTPKAPPKTAPKPTPPAQPAAGPAGQPGGPPNQ